MTQAVQGNPAMQGDLRDYNTGMVQGAEVDKNRIDLFAQRIFDHPGKERRIKEISYLLKAVKSLNHFIFGFKQVTKLATIVTSTMFIGMQILVRNKSDEIQNASDLCGAFAVASAFFWYGSNVAYNFYTQQVKSFEEEHPSLVDTAVQAYLKVAKIGEAQSPGTVEVIEVPNTL